MSIVVTGATGALGRLVIDELLARVPAEQVAAVVRDKEKAAGLAARGVELRIADYDDPASLTGAFRSGDRVLLISGSEVGRRVPQHTAVIEAAKAAGVAQLAYTGVLGGPDADFQLAAEHKVTEQLILDSGLPTPSCATAGTPRTTPPTWRRSSHTARSSPTPVRAGSPPPPAPTTRLPRLPSSSRTGTWARSTS